MNGDDPERRWGAFADELGLNDKERKEFLESLGQMQRGEGQVVRSGELRRDHCAWCRVERWIFASFENALLTILGVFLLIIVLSLVAFVGCIAGGTLLKL